MIKYKGYSIYPDMTGIADFQYYFTLYQDEIVQGFGDSVEECENLLFCLVIKVTFISL